MKKKEKKTKKQRIFVFCNGTNNQQTYRFYEHTKLNRKEMTGRKTDGHAERKTVGKKERGGTYRHIDIQTTPAL